MSKCTTCHMTGLPSSTKVIPAFHRSGMQRRQFRWAGKVARCTDGRWTKKVLTWSVEGSRRQGRSEMRWTDGLNNLFGEDYENITWMTLADDMTFWNDFEESYIKWILR